MAALAWTCAGCAVLCDTLSHAFVGDGLGHAYGNTFCGAHRNYHCITQSLNGEAAERIAALEDPKHVTPAPRLRGKSMKE